MACVSQMIRAAAQRATLVTYVRVSNPKSKSMQNELISVLSSRSTLGMIETTPQIGEAPDKVRTNAILNHKRMYKKGYVTKIMRTGAGALN